MEKKKCELCEGVARMYCESDKANLCWNCDVMVHGANFLVAKHTRCLLCSVCQSPTSWKASGIRLSPTVSICDSCLTLKNNSIAGRRITNLNLSREISSCVFHGDRLRSEDDGAESYDVSYENEEEEEEEETESQVVPLMVSLSSSVNSNEKAFSGDGGGVVEEKTKRHVDDSRPLKRSRNLVKING